MTTTILILAANPTDTARLRLGEEVREIQDGLSKAKNREDYELEQQWAVRPRDVQQAMLDHSPNIVHFCGHGGGNDGIAFEDNQGNSHLVQTTALANLFKLFSEDIQCVVLNACYSEVQARAIARHIPYVIGMNKAIGDKAAIEFAVAFYKAIGASKSIEFAYKLGCNAIEMAGIPENLTPVLKHKNSLDVPSSEDSPRNIIKLFSTDPQQQPEKYIIDTLQNALKDNGYTLQIIDIKQNETLLLKKLKQTGENTPIIFLPTDASEFSKILKLMQENKTESKPILIQLNDANPLTEEQQALLTDQTTCQWRSPVDDPVLTQQILNFLQNPVRNHKKTSGPEPRRDKPTASGIHNKIHPDLWLSFLLEKKNKQIVSNWLQSDSMALQKTPANELLPFTNTPEQQSTLSRALLGDSESWQKKLLNLLQEKKIGHWQEANIRIRIMTDDPQLATIPWQQMETGVDAKRTIEISPVIISYQPGFSEQSITAPLVVIPAGQEYGIGGDTHYRLIQEYLDSYLDIRGSIPRVYTPDQLKREINFQHPDLLYLYAKCENGGILLDSDYTSDDKLTLETIGEWLEESETRPVVILSLIGHEIKSYPETLIKNSRLLWIQQTRRLSRLDDLGDNLADILNGLTKTPDIANVIQLANQNPKYEINSHLWINGKSVAIAISDKENAHGRQLRAALLKVMLGRKELKERMFSEIYRSDLINNSAFITYVISGKPMACPFDFPAQLQQRLNFDDSEHFLPVIPFYFHIDIKPQRDAFDTIDIALGQGILHGTTDIARVFQEELERRGLLNQDCCISLNWLFTVTVQQLQELSEWLEIWIQILCSDFSEAIPETTVLVSAACIQVIDAENEQDCQKIQDRANRIIHNDAQCPLHPIRIPDALGKLRTYEIEDFLRNNTHWRQELQLDDYGITPVEYAEWIFEQAKGDFDTTVRLVWQQYQRGYEDYLTDKN